MRNTSLKYSACLLFIYIVILFSCRKFDAFKNKEAPEEVFSVAAAKEWFYGKFKKSASYYDDDAASIFSMQTATITARRQPYKKYPFWNEAVAYANGTMFVVEAPLFIEANTLLLPGMQSATPAERKRVAAATLHKVVFVQTGTQQTDVRIISIIPTLRYLQSHSYDISNNTARSVAADFEGFYVVRGWNNRVYRFLEVQQGKILRSVNFLAAGNNGGVQRKTDAAPESNVQNSSGMCGEWVWVPNLQRVCVSTGVCKDDVPCPEPPCEEWVEIDKGTLEFQVDPDCAGGGGGTGDPFGDCLLSGTDYNTCLCTLWGICDGGGGGGGNGDPLNDGDPCAEAQLASNATTTLSQVPVYINAQNNIEQANQNVENSITFGKNSNGEITASPMISCTDPSTCTVNSNWPGAFADLHNHTNNLPPSPGDMYNLIGINNNHSAYNTRLVLTPNGSLYALVIIDLNKANSFISANPPVNNGFGPDFSLTIYLSFDQVVDQFRQQGLSPLISEERAMAYILDKYNTGIVLLKQDSNGNFKRLKTDEATVNGNTIYTAQNCN